ncbi:nicotinate-nucleotide adenylyltransferase [Spirochaetia bacterium]|nr:nicotinate-nucleotide adenylyltransferase [Spirochaetia bacterium]
MRLAILGGSFNPVHIGHLFLADAVLTAFGYDRIILIPAFKSPFKQGASGGSPLDRLDMLAAAIPGDPRLGIDDCEIKREGVSYTIDTIADITRRYRPEGKPGLILGDDLAREFPKWKSADEIAEQADVIIARRLLSGDGVYPYPNRQLQNEVMEVSSALVRERIGEGKNWRCLVPLGTRTIIEDRRLYGLPATEGDCGEKPAGAGGGKAAITQALIVEMEEAARGKLNSARFHHSRNTALLAADLCRHFGLESKAGYLAGIIHDMGKPLGEEELLHLAKADGGEISKLERKKPGLLHGRAGAVMLKERYGIRSQEVLDAVKYHTTGNAAMGPLAKVLYIADKIEVSRERIDPALRNFSAHEGTEQGLDRLFGTVLNETVAWLRSREMDISEGTLRLLELIEKRGLRRGTSAYSLGGGYR